MVLNPKPYKNPMSSVEGWWLAVCSVFWLGASPWENLLKDPPDIWSLKSKALDV